jgi:TatD DNase family protein
LLFDTHAHYDDARFDIDRDALLPSLPAHGIGYVLNVGVDMESSRKASALARAYAHVWAAAGIHPHDAAGAPPDFEDELAGMFAFEKVVAVGEIGLDYHYDMSPRAVQRGVFERQLALACKLRKPVVIHARDAHGDAIDIVREHRRELCGGVFHCFTSGPDALEPVLELGFHVAFGGAATFRNAGGIAAAAANTPSGRLLIETDAPYMSPEPFRGKRNDSTRLPLVVERLAGIRGVPPGDIAELTRENAKRLFAIG